jgi:hypothetical protein
MQATSSSPSVSTTLDSGSGILPSDSVSQVLRPTHNKKKKANDLKPIDEDDLTDEAECDEENELRKYHLFYLRSTYCYIGRLRRGWTAKTYENFEKAQLVKNDNGSVVMIGGNNGQRYAQHFFKCKRYVYMSLYLF